VEVDNTSAPFFLSVLILYDMTYPHGLWDNASRVAGIKALLVYKVILIIPGFMILYRTILLIL
jgi:hypothetical protein